MCMAGLPNCWWCTAAQIRIFNSVRCCTAARTSGPHGSDWFPVPPSHTLPREFWDRLSHTSPRREASLLDSPWYFGTRAFFCTTHFISMKRICSHFPLERWHLRADQRPPRTPSTAPLVSCRFLPPWSAGVRCMCRSASRLAKPPEYTAACPTQGRASNLMRDPFISGPDSLKKTNSQPYPGRKSPIPHKNSRIKSFHTLVWFQG